MSAQICLSAYSQTVIPFQTGGNSQTLTAPILTHTYQGNVLKYTFSAENMSLYTEFASDNNMYAHLYMKSIGFTSEVGKAELPTFYDYVPVASENATVNLINTNGSEIPNMDIWPFQQPVNISDSISYPFYRDSLFYATNAYYPNNPVEILEYQTIDDRVYAFIRVCPIQYNPVQRKVRCFSEINYSISNYYIPSSASEPDDGIIRTQEDYLIVCNDSALDAISDFVEWKEMQGFNVHVIHSSNWNQYSSVRDSVKAYYRNCGNCRYLLIAGDYEMVPAEIIEEITMYSNGQYTWSDTARYVSDFNLSCTKTLNNPQFSIGRIPCANITEIHSVLDKIYRYQSNPSYSGIAVNCSYFSDKDRNGEEDYISILACENIKSFLESCGYNVSRVYNADNPENLQSYNRFYAGSLSQDLLYPIFLWNGWTMDVINGFNSNPNIFLYIGHGMPAFWYNFNFYTGNILQLTNSIYPIVLSLGCQNGQYVDILNSDMAINKKNIAYELLKNDSCGASAVIAPTCEIRTFFTEIWAQCWYDAIIANKDMVSLLNKKQIPHNAKKETHTIGDAMIGALVRYRKYYGGGYNEKLYKSLLCFGDPSTELYTDYPEDISIVEVKQINDSIIVDTHGIEDCSVLLIPKDPTEKHLYMRADSITGRFVFPDIVTSYNVSVQKHNCALCFYDSYDIYLQNLELTNGVTRRYEGRNVFIGRNIIDEVSYGDVIVRNGANLFVKAYNKVKTSNHFKVETSGIFKIE